MISLTLGGSTLHCCNHTCYWNVNTQTRNVVLTDWQLAHDLHNTADHIIAQQSSMANTLRQCQTYKEIWSGPVHRCKVNLVALVPFEQAT